MMRLLLGILCILFGAFGWIGQLISSINFKLAQRLNLQEPAKYTDPLFRQLERNAAWWDAIILWPMVIAGILMVLNHPWWPFISLIAGGIYIDTGGRESAKYLGLKTCAVKVGTSKNIRTATGCYLTMIGLGIWVLLYALYTIMTQQ